MTNAERPNDIEKIIGQVRGDIEKHERELEREQQSIEDGNIRAAFGGAKNSENLNVESKNLEPEIYEIKAIWNGIDKKILDLPISSVTCIFSLRNVHISIANGLKRVLMDEVESHCLSIKPGSFHTTDPFMIEHFVRNRIELIPLLRILNPEIKNMKFKLHIHNTSQDILAVYSKDIKPIHGKLPAPIMNPTFKLAELQPGSELKIDEISIASGIGRNRASFAIGCAGSIRHLDVPRFSAEEINNKGGKAAYGSGYKISSLLVNSRNHEVQVVFQAMNEDTREIHCKKILREACNVILKYNNIVRKEVRHHTNNMVKIISPDMTDTIGHIIARYFYELNPDIDHVSYECVPHKMNMEVTVKHKYTEDEINKKLDNTFNHIDYIFKTIYGQI